jgi:hypothetical protein
VGQGLIEGDHPVLPAQECPKPGEATGVGIGVHTVSTPPRRPRIHPIRPMIDFSAAKCSLSDHSAAKKWIKVGSGPYAGRTTFPSSTGEASSSFAGSTRTV